MDELHQDLVGVHLALGTEVIEQSPEVFSSLLVLHRPIVVAAVRASIRSQPRADRVASPDVSAPQAPRVPSKAHEE
jgi:hypothetical protein